MLAKAVGVWNISYYVTAVNYENLRVKAEEFTITVTDWCAPGQSDSTKGTIGIDT